MNDKPYIVLGLGPSGLFLVRQLQNITSNIYGIGRNDDVGLYSKYIKKEKRFVAETEETLLIAFQQIVGAETEKPILYICSDQYLSLLLRAKTNLEKYFTLAGSDFSVLRLINDKSRVNRHCLHDGIQITFVVDLEQAAQDPSLEYPVIVRWKEKRLNERKNPVGKIRICESREDLDALNKKIQACRISPNDFFVQQYITGDNRWQYSVGGYYHSGKALAQVVVNQVKQYPQGISAQVITVSNEYEEPLRQQTNRLACSLNFTGFLEVEYKVNPINKVIYLLDINPRPWGWVSILGSVCPNFHLALMNRQPDANSMKAIWKSNLRCLLSFRNPKNANIPFDRTGYARARDIYDPKDKIPSLMLYLMALKKVVKRISK